ncbi:MAG: hypothetical protein ABSH53_17015 [Holophaga sp.]|jgi:predicted Zn-dependent protease
MVAHGKDKIIQVQKPAQSLQAFQKQVASEEDVRVGYLKPLLVGAGVAVAAVAVWFGVRAVRSGSMEKHQEALADLQLEVMGNPPAPGTPPSADPDLEKRMRDGLPKLEALARSAPRGARAVTQGLLTTWRVELGEKAQASAVPSDPWGKVRLAQKQVALGKGQEAAATLNSLRGSADPDRAWSALFWSTLLDADRLQGNREQAWKDLAEYKVRFKAQADPELDRLLAGV